MLLAPDSLSSFQSGLPGFYDPCVGEEKSLKVLYQFRGVMHQVVSGDAEPLRIPKQCKAGGSRPQSASRASGASLSPLCLFAVMQLTGSMQTHRSSATIRTHASLSAWTEDPGATFRYDTLNLLLGYCAFSLLCLNLINYSVGLD